MSDAKVTVDNGFEDARCSRMKARTRPRSRSRAIKPRSDRNRNLSDTGSIASHAADHPVGRLRASSDDLAALRGNRADFSILADEVTPLVGLEIALVADAGPAMDATAIIVDPRK
jgi:hypothetical protein